MFSRPFDIIVVGDCGVDVYARVPRLPAHDEKVPADFLGFHGGGVAANFACAASRLGARIALLATVGPDSFGEIAVASVAEYGVNVDHIARMPGETTSFCFVSLDDSGEKALTIVRTPTFFPRLEDLDTTLFQQANAVHIAPFDLEASERIARAARAAGAAVTIDLEPGMAGQGYDAVERLLAHATLVMPNQLVLDMLFAGVSTSKAAARLLALGPEAVIVTRGRNGALVVDASGEEDVPAIPTNVVDTTGAGDCFNAALISSWLRGESLAAAAHLGAAAASLSITAVGARGHLPSREEAEALLAQHARVAQA